MKESQNEIYYARIAEAIRFIRDNRREQPRLETVAEAVNMSPFHFQRIFKQWAGITPKHFLQYLNVEYAKRILQQTHASLFDTAQEVGHPASIRTAERIFSSITVLPRRLSGIY